MMADPIWRLLILPGNPAGGSIRPALFALVTGNDLQDAGAVAFAGVLKSNRSLQELHIGGAMFL